MGWGNEKFVQMVQVTWLIWPPCPYIIKKKLKNLLLWNQKADDLESWYVALGARVLPSLFKWWCWGWHWPILRQGQIWSPMLLYGKKLKEWIFQKLKQSYDIRVGRCSHLNEYMKLNEYQRSRSFTDLGPNHPDSIFLNFFSSITAYFNISSALRWAIQDQWSSGSI